MPVAGGGGGQGNTIRTVFLVIRAMYGGSRVLNIWRMRESCLRSNCAWSCPEMLLFRNAKYRTR